MKKIELVEIMRWLLITPLNLSYKVQYIYFAFWQTSYVFEYVLHKDILFVYLLCVSS